jgi:hypothetical protein
MSAPKLARPVTLSTPSGRIGRAPTYLKRLLVEIAHPHLPRQCTTPLMVLETALSEVLGTLARSRMVSHPAYKAYQ